LAQELGVPLLGQVPLATDVREGGDIGLPIVIADPASPAAEAFNAIAQRIAEMRPARVRRQELRIT
jgi:ATP-binding protein involved in chromosome partitioning